MALLTTLKSLRHSSMYLSSSLIMKEESSPYWETHCWFFLLARQSLYVFPQLPLFNDAGKHFPNNQKEVRGQSAPLPTSHFKFEVFSWITIEVDRNWCIMKDEYNPSNEFLTNSHFAHSMKQEPPWSIVVGFLKNLFLERPSADWKTFPNGRFLELKNISKNEF